MENLSTIDIKEIKTLINISETQLNKLIGKKNHIINSISEENKKLKEKNKIQEDLKKIISLLELTTKKARTLTIGVLENIMNDALEFVLDDEVSKIKITLEKKRNKPFAEIKLIKNINDQISEQSIIDANGGGYADVIATTLRYVYAELHKKPKILGTFVFDEPGKMVDEFSSVKFAQFLFNLKEHFNRQNIVISHNANLMNVSDKTFYVSQNDTISEVDILEDESIKSEVLNLFKSASEEIESEE